MIFRKKFKKKEEPLWKSFQYALEGLSCCLSSERNLGIHFFVMTLVIIGGFLFQITIAEWIICLILFSAVISAELMNTAIETTVDICSPEINPKAKLAKDTAAAAVLVLAFTSCVIGLFIFVPRIYEFLERL
ncbi:MAG: diacylglycerol kinase family protein [Bacilli bacterium]|nr:diacylglycerol kinase family protein [Bacilli bacterium]